MAVFRCPSGSSSVLMVDKPSEGRSKPRLLPRYPRKKVGQPSVPTPAPTPAPKAVQHTTRKSARRNANIPGKLKRSDSASLAAFKEKKRQEIKAKSKAALKRAAPSREPMQESALELELELKLELEKELKLERELELRLEQEQESKQEQATTPVRPLHHQDTTPLPQKQKKRPYSFVYVGNLDPTITDAQLKSIFEHCGPIQSVIVRCSRGQAIRQLPENYPPTFFGPQDTKYASIEFRDSYARVEALKLNGKVFDGTKLVVCVSAAELPEAILPEPARTSGTPSTPTSGPVPVVSAARIPELSSPAKPTRQKRPMEEMAEEEARPTKALRTTVEDRGRGGGRDRDRFRLLGLSFAKCII